MQSSFSVVIICKNAAATILKAVESALAVTTDVVVIDTGSTDDTVSKVNVTNARLYQQEWKGYGATKNIGNALAKNDWVFSLDADEYIDESLQKALQQLPLVNDNEIFTMLRINYLGAKAIRHGEWKNDIVIRLFNRRKVQWNTALVHEELVHPAEAIFTNINGAIHHYTSPDIDTYKEKLKNYAQLMAHRYAAKGKRGSSVKIYLSPAINFLQNYIVNRGFLDGKEGLQIALANAAYTYNKYKLLKRLK